MFLPNGIYSILNKSEGYNIPHINGLLFDFMKWLRMYKKRNVVVEYVVQGLTVLVSQRSCCESVEFKHLLNKLNLSNKAKNLYVSSFSRLKYTVSVLFSFESYDPQWPSRDFLVHKSYDDRRSQCCVVHVVDFLG